MLLGLTRVHFFTLTLHVIHPLHSFIGLRRPRSLRSLRSPTTELRIEYMDFGGRASLHIKWSLFRTPRAQRPCVFKLRVDPSRSVLSVSGSTTNGPVAGWPAESSPVFLSGFILIRAWGGCASPLDGPMEMVGGTPEYGGAPQLELFQTAGLRRIRARVVSCRAGDGGWCGLPVQLALIQVDGAMLTSNSPPFNLTVPAVSAVPASTAPPSQSTTRVFQTQVNLEAVCVAV